MGYVCIPVSFFDAVIDQDVYVCMLCAHVCTCILYVHVIVIASTYSGAQKKVTNMKKWRLYNEGFSKLMDELHLFWNT